MVIPALAGMLLVAGCGTDSASDSGTDVAATTPAATDPVPPAEPTSSATPKTDDGDAPIGSVLVSAALGVNALDYPASMPVVAEVSEATEIASVFPGVPGIEEVVAEVQARRPAPGQRLFVYVVAACTVDDLSLRLRGEEVTMVVSGTATLKCEPPPMQMVVWTVGSDEVPPDAVPARAIQK